MFPFILGLRLWAEHEQLMADMFFTKARFLCPNFSHTCVPVEWGCVECFRDKGLIWSHCCRTSVKLLKSAYRFDLKLTHLLFIHLSWVEHEFIRDLFRGGEYFSVTSVQHLFTVKNILQDWVFVSKMDEVMVHFNLLLYFILTVYHLRVTSSFALKHVHLPVSCRLTCRPLRTKNNNPCQAKFGLFGCFYKI